MRSPPFWPPVSSFSSTFLFPKVLSFWNGSFYLIFVAIRDKCLPCLDKWLIRTIVGVLGKSTSEASFTIMYLYTTELYPTVVRLVSHYVNKFILLLYGGQCNICLLCLLQTERFGLHCLFGPPGCVRIPTSRSIRGRVASAPSMHLLCCGSELRCDCFTPAWNIKRSTARVHRRHWENQVNERQFSGKEFCNPIFNLQ